MSAIDDGGPAFPTHNTGCTSTPEGIIQPQFPGQDGMSLRDWLAGQALTGCIASPDNPPGDTCEEKRNNLCRVAYEYADAMLAARKERAS